MHSFSQAFIRNFWIEILLLNLGDNLRLKNYDVNKKQLEKYIPRTILYVHIADKNNRRPIKDSYTHIMETTMQP